MSAIQREEICAALEQLPQANVKALLEVLRKLPAGKPLRRWRAAVGTLTAKEAAEMQRVIEEGCEKVEEDS